MRRLTESLATPMSGSLARQARLLLMLTAALAGFFLLLEFLVSLLSSGPQDILAATPLQQDTIELPNGVGLLEAAVFGVSLCLAAVVLLASAAWPLSRSSFRPTPSLAVGVLAALALAGAGGYLAFSGVLGMGVGYSEHTVHRSILEPSGLALLGAVFLTLVIAGFINRYALVLLIVAWVGAAAAFGFLDTRPVDGLYLFERPEKLGVPRDYSDTVDRYRQTDDLEIVETEEKTEFLVEIEVPQEPDVNAAVVPVVSTEASKTPERVPLFWVSGAYHTRYLRTSTGDAYEHGTWTQLDLGHLPIDKGIVVPNEVNAVIGELQLAQSETVPPERLHAALLAYPTAEAVEFAPDVIILTPYFEKDTFSEGIIPSAKFLVKVDVPASYYPFSATLQAPGPTRIYQLEVTIPRFEPRAIVDALPAGDPTYLQLPEDMPARVQELAEQFKGDESAYIRANRIHGFLRQKYSYGTPGPGRVIVESPAGHDPVEWFLFERFWGDSSSFSSAFVVLARAAGIPARVVAGWAIEESQEPKVVNADQAHQWAEIALEGIGWVTFDPTRYDAFPLEVEEEPLPELMEDLTENSDEQERKEAAEALGDLGDPEALPALVDAALNDPALSVQLAGEAAIHKIGVDELIWLLLNHEDPIIRESAADGLRIAASSKAVDALRQALSSDVDARVREASVKALERIGGAKAEEGLLQAAIEDDDTGVRVAAVQALGTREANWTAEEVVTLLGEDADGEVREAAAQTLGKLGEPVALWPLLNARDFDLLQDVSLAAAEALLAWSFDDLTLVLFNAEYPIEQAAAQIFGELGDIDAVQVLARALNDPDEEVREAALDALMELGEIEWFENGSGLLTDASGSQAFIVGTTTLAAMKPPQTPVFTVTGARNTGYLRTGVGEIYENGGWLAQRETGLPYEAFTNRAPLSGLLPSEGARFPKLDDIAVANAQSDQEIPRGIVPTSKRLERLGVHGTYWPQSATFSTDEPVLSYDWVSNIDDFSDGQLYFAERMTGLVDSPYTSLPEWARRGRIYDLAVEITAGHTTPYLQAKAIEEYLRANYTYKFAESAEDVWPPDGRDPIDWFLFDKREGTCGNFSSAFVFLARAIGLPARVVTGWAIGQTPDEQTVNLDQAHQWAEVAFERLGWIDFEPTPAGPASRVAELTLSGGDAEAAEDALKALEEAGEDVVKLENGGALVDTEDGLTMSSGTTTAQSSGLPHIPVFKVTGAANTSYLRTASGDVYENGRWRQLDPVSLKVLLGTNVAGEVGREYRTESSQFLGLPFERRINASLFGIRGSEYTWLEEEIVAFALDQHAQLPAGLMPMTRDLQSMTLRGEYFPFSNTFRSSEATPAYSWISRIPTFSRAELERAGPASDPTYLQLPPDLPERIRELALRVTRSHSSPYAKARALASYLSSTYPYRFADGPEDILPAGRDPVDWFLFDHKEGTCGVYSSAFVVMARSIGIPARVASGWAIAATPRTQTVFADQAHQWAEIALEGIGWVTFEPTGGSGGGGGSGSGGSGGPLARAESALSDEEPPAIPSRPLDTVTTITEWPEGVRRDRPFTVGGTVNTASGHTIDGMEVEIYVNETKEHGGIKIGTAVTRFGRWTAEARMPRDIKRGPFQLLARAVENTFFNESWSDPDIAVFSGTGIELSGPARVPVEGDAVFTGRLTEEIGTGVDGRELAIAVDGTETDTVMTGEFGRFMFTLTFTEPGPHWVEVELKEQDYLLDNNVRLDLEVTLPTETTVEAPVAVEVGEEFQVTGTLYGARGEALASRPIAVRIGDLPEQRAVTDDAGVFELTATLDATGAHTVSAEFFGDGPVLYSGARARVAVHETSIMTVEGPSIIEQGNGATITGRLTTAAGAPIAQTTLSIFDDGGAELATVTTDDDGAFEYQQESLFETGPQSLTVEYAGEDFIVATSAQVAFTVLAPTFLTMETASLVRDGEAIVLRGTLRDPRDQPVPDAEVEVTGVGLRTLTTDAEGNFTWETVAQFDAIASDSPHEAPLTFEAAFAGTDHLAPSAAAAEIVIAVPRLLLEPLDTVARGDAVTLRGTMLLGERPMPEVTLAVGDQGTVQSDATGAFAHRYHVSGDAPLGSSEVTVTATDLGISESVPLEVKSNVNIVVTPIETVRPGELAVLQATLLDDRWQGIPRATLRSGDGMDLVTDGLGVALLEIMAPEEEEEALAIPMTFTFDGDGQHLPFTYFISIPVTPYGFNWLLWVGAPSIVAALAAAGFAGRRTDFGPLAFLNRRRASAATVAEEEDDLEEEEAIDERSEATLGIDFTKPAADLPDVWGVGEEVAMTLRALDSEGEPCGGMEIAAAIAGEPAGTFVTGDDGTVALRWTAAEPSVHTLLAQFAGDENRLPAYAERTLRVVDFREEIVRLYNIFLGRARAWTGSSLDQATPREVELLLVQRGLPVPQKSLDELISRFEEADYSEHPITRRHYESMYRAWRAVVEG